VKALVDLIFKWPSGTEGVLVCTLIDNRVIKMKISEIEALIVLTVFFFFFLKQERAAGALANLAADDKCSMEVALAGGVHALVTLARSCKVDGVQEQVSTVHHYYHFILAPLCLVECL